MNWNYFQEWLFRENDASCVHSPLSFQAFKAARGINNFLSIWISFVNQPKFTSLAIPIILGIKYSREGDVLTHNRGRKSLGDLVTNRIWISQNSCRILERLLRLNVAVRNDLSNAIFAIFICGVCDHFGAPSFIKVQVNIRH